MLETKPELVLLAAVLVSGKKKNRPGAMVHICNPSYSGGRDRKHCGLKPARAKS
jgi:hypothetical protein